MKATYNELLEENKLLRKEINSLKKLRIGEKKDLIDSAENFRSIFENSPTGIAIVSLEGHYLMVNPALSKIIGYSEDELLSIDFFKITHPDDIEISQNILKKVRESKDKNIVYSKRYIHKNGQTIWAEVNSVLVYGNNNEPSHFITHINNITERKLSEEALLISQVQLSNAMKMARLGYWEYDVAKDLFTFNDSFYAIFRTTAEQVGGYTMSSFDYANRFIYHEEIEAIAIEIQRAVESDDPDYSHQLEHRFIYADGEIGHLSVRFFVVKDDKGKTIKTYGVNQDITERKKAEEAIRKSEQKFAKAFNTGSVTMAISEINSGKFIEVNDTFCSTFGYRKEEVIGTTAARLGILDNDSQRDLFMNDVRKQGFARNIEIDLHTSNRELRHGLISADYIDFGKEKYLLITMIDITERKRAEEALQYSEMHFRAMVENSGDGITLLDAEGNIIYEGPTVERIIGYKPGEWLGKKVIDLVHPDDLHIVQYTFNKLLKNSGAKENLVFRLIRKEGSTLWIDATGTNLLDKPSVKAIVINYRDVTLRKQAEEALQKSQETLARITSSIDDIIYSINANTGQFEFLSPVFERKFGYSLSDIDKMGGRWAFLKHVVQNNDIPNLDPVIHDLKKNHVKETPIWEQWWQRKDGLMRYIEDRSVPVYENNKLVRIDGVLRDITERKKAEESLKESEEKFSKAFHLMPVSMAISTISDGKYLDINEAFIKLTEYPREMIIGKTSLDLDIWVHREKRTKIRKELLAGKKIQEVPVKFYTKSGKTLDILYSSVVIKLGNQQCLISLALNITERNRAQEALREERSLLRTIVDNLPIALYIKDKEGRKVISNPVDLENIGQPESEVLGKTDEDFLPDEVSIKTIADDTKVLFSGVPMVNKEEFIVSKSGKAKWLLTTKIPMKNNEGDITGIIGMGLDITERKRTEEALKESQVRYRELFENMNSGVAVYEVINNGKDFIYKDFNKAAERIDKEKREDIIGKSIYKARPGIKEFGLIEVLKKVWQTGNPAFHPVTLYKYDRLANWYENYVYKLPSGEIMAVFENVTERKKAEEEIASHNKRLECLVRISQFKAETTQQLLDFAMNEAIELTNSEKGFIHLYNESTKKLTLTSCSKNVLNDSDIKSVQKDFDLDKAGSLGKVIQQRKLYISNNFGSNKKFENITPIEHIKINKFLSIPVIIDDKIVATVGVANKESDYNNMDAQQLVIIMDSVWKMMEKQRYQEELVIAKEKAEESDKLKSAFLANMSHEIRTPMNAIIGFSEILLKPALTEEKRNKYTIIVINSCKKLMSIVNDILDISIIDSGQVEIKKEDVIINKVIFELFTLYDNLAKTNNIDLYFHNTLDNKSSTIFTDKLKLNQILNNLLNNAFKFTSKGQIDFGYELKDGYFEFFVRDSGIGIPKHLQNVIFERFRQAELELTRQYGGTGLGLSISQKLVELLGGKLWVESEPDKGSTFYFTIPYDRLEKDIKQKPKKRIKKKNTILSNRPFTILVAEDEENNFLYIEEVLSESGINPLHATNGLEAVDLCKRNMDIGLVLMDIKMPKMNGIEATKEIKKIRPDLRIIALTAFAMDSEKRYVLSEGCDDYISKPVSPELLHKIIKQNISRDKKK